MSDQEFLQKIGDKISLVRKKKGMSQMDVCAKLNMEKTYLSSIENGRQNPTLLTLRNIGQALDIDVIEFFL